MRFHRLQNVQIALDFLKQRQVRADKSSSSRAGWFVDPLSCLRLWKESRSSVSLRWGVPVVLIEGGFQGVFPCGCCASGNQPCTQEPL